MVVMKKIILVTLCVAHSIFAGNCVPKPLTGEEILPMSPQSVLQEEKIETNISSTISPSIRSEFAKHERKRTFTFQHTMVRTQQINQAVPPTPVHKKFHVVLMVKKDQIR